MFLGSIPPDLRRIVAETVRPWGRDQSVAIACSGNFTIERAIHSEVGPLLGNDVTIYSSTIGRWLTGEDPRLDVKVDRFEWLAKWLTDPVDKVATMLLSASAFVGPVAGGHPHYDRVARLYRDQWPELHAGTVERLRALPVKLESFHCGDCREFLGAIGDTPVISFPPFLAAAGYEAQFRNLGRIFDWDAPDYPPLDADGLGDFIHDVANRPRWIFGVPFRRDDLEPHLRGMTQTTRLGVPIYVYSSEPTDRVALRHAKMTPPRWPLLQPADELTGELTLVDVSSPELEHVRSMFLDKSIVTAAPRNCWGVLDAGRLLGVYATGVPAVSFMSMTSPLEPHAYLFTDLPVASTRYKRLSKLVLYAALSEESRVRFEEAYGRPIRSLTTSAFTDRPVSMKYRGLFSMMKRVDLPAGSGHAFRLDYWAPFGGWSLREGMAEWTRRHAG